MADNEVSYRLRRLREARGLSQRQLAGTAGVTGSVISMIERGQTSPSVATLKKILTGLDITLGDFFSDDEEPADKWYFAADELREINPEIAFGNSKEAKRGHISLRQVGAAGRSTIQMLHEQHLPGADSGPECYSHEGEEAGIVVEGEIEITVGDETRTLKVGDAYLFDSRIPHRMRNNSNKRCVVISACTPPTF